MPETCAVRLRIEIGGPAEGEPQGRGADGVLELRCANVRDLLFWMTPEMLRVLKVLAEAPGLTERDLATRLNRGRDRVESDLGRLLAYGLVARANGGVILREDLPA